MAKKRSSKASPRKAIAKRAKTGGAHANVADFLNLVTRDKAIGAKLKKTRQFNLMILARALGYTFTKAQLVSGMRKRWGAKVPVALPFTCVIIMRDR
jgi:hypothetical protein